MQIRDEEKWGGKMVKTGGEGAIIDLQKKKRIPEVEEKSEGSGAREADGGSQRSTHAREWLCDK